MDVPPKKTFWWLKGAAGKADNSSKDAESPVPDRKQSVLSTQSSVSSSMAEFLETERICREGSKTRSVDGDNKSQRSIKPESSAPIAEYSDDFTDDDISSIMDQLSTLTGSGLDESGKSVDDILKEAEEAALERLSTNPLRQESPDRPESRNSKGLRSQSKELTPPPPLSKPSSQLVNVNFKNKDTVQKSKKNESTTLLRDTPKMGSTFLPSQYDRVIEDADAIFEEIEKEVKNKIAASKDKKIGHTIVSMQTDQRMHLKLDEELKRQLNLDLSATSFGGDDAVDSRPNIKDISKKVDPLKRSFSPLRGEPLSVVIEESTSDFSSLEPEIPTKLSKESLSSRSSQESSRKEQISHLEKELADERHKYEKLKAEMDNKARHYKTQLEEITCKCEDERFALEKDVYLLKAKLQESEQHKISPKEVGVGDMNSNVLDHRLKLLEDELQKQEQIIIVYQNENVKLCQEVKQLKNELKEKESLLGPCMPLSGRRPTVAETSEKEALREKLIYKEEVIAKLNSEIEMLKVDKFDIEKSTEDLKLSNAQLTLEAEKYKQMTSELKSNYISGSVIKLEKELEQEKQDSSMKDVEIKSLNHDLKELTNAFEGKKLAMMTAIADGRGKIETLEMKMEDLRMALEKERKVAEVMHREQEDDKRKLQDMNNQVRDLEQALLKNSTPTVEESTSQVENTTGMVDDSLRVKYLEKRIQQLEEELESTKAELESGVKNIQDKFKTIKNKYDLNMENLTAELESWRQEAILWKDAAEVVKCPEPENKKTVPLCVKETVLVRKSSQPQPPPVNAQAVKEDSHLVATIRGLNQELRARDKTVRMMEKKLDDANKTNRRLQAERERLLAQHASNKGINKVTKKSHEDKQLVLRNELATLERQAVLEQTISQIQEANTNLEDELHMLRVELKEANERRLHDLEQMQEEHEAEMAELGTEHSLKIVSSRSEDLQAQIRAQQQVINDLRDQLKQLDEYRAEIMVLKVEREHLEKSLREANKKLSFIRQSQTPDQAHYESLYDKLEELEVRHECREQKLQSVVRDLLKQNRDKENQSEQVTALREKVQQKNREIWYYKTEMDKILQRVAEVEREVAENRQEGH